MVEGTARNMQNPVGILPIFMGVKGA
jgi:hypothetical protein